MSFVSTYNACSIRGWSNPDAANNVIYYNNLLQPTPTDVQDGNNVTRAAFFGISADISTNGNYIVVGETSSYYSVLTGAVDGAVYVFENTISGQLLDTILTSNNNTYVGFGLCCSINNFGNILAVGTPNKNQGNLTNAGSVYIFTKTSGNWSLATTINPSFGISNSYFGSNVHLSNDGTVLLVNHPGGTGFNSPGASIYYNNSNASTWTLYHQQTANVSINPGFGRNIALAKNSTSTDLSNVRYVIGDMSANSYRGGFSIMKGQNLVSNISSSVLNSGLGNCLSMSSSGNIIVAGAPGFGPGGANIVGSAKVYANISGNYSLQATISQPNNTANTEFGMQVAVNESGNIVLIGELQSNVTLNGNTGPITYSNIGRGYAYSGSNFSYSQSNTYISSQIVYPLNPLYFQTNYFSTYGVAIDGSGNNRIFGAPNDTLISNVARRVGSEYIFNS